MRRSHFILGMVVVLGGLGALAVGVVVGQPGRDSRPTQPPPPPPAASTGRPVEKPAIEDKNVVPASAEVPEPSSGYRSVGQDSPSARPSGGTPSAFTRGKQLGTGAPQDDAAPASGDGPGQSNDNPTGRQEPAVSIEWIGPPTAKIGQPVVYQIVLKNLSSSPVQQVVVRNRVPAGVSVQSTEPKAFTEGKTLMWDLGTLQPRQEKRLDLNIIADIKGDLPCQATVTFTGSSTARLRVREPKLAIKATSPEKTLVGEVVNVTFTVSNPGDGPADQVKVKAMIPDGLEHTRGKLVEFEIGSLAAGENRSVALVCMSKAGGQHPCEAIATAEGGLLARDSAMVDIITPKLDLAFSGPRLRYLDRHAIYTLKVTNDGSAPTSNVMIADQVPQGFKFLSASNGGRHDFATRTVTWFIGDLTPGQAREVTFEVVAVNTGEHKHHAKATAARGLKSETDITTRVEGLPALLMELVDLDDPVEVGADTAYEIRITNTGSKTETNLQLICTIPDKMEFKSATFQGTACRQKTQGKEIVFEPVARLAPRADVIYRVNVKGLAPGDLRFKARITADGLTEAVHKEESTKVYGDDPQSK
jgi:uncharacterized repeat protein (TIGR01451 family)